MNKFIAIVALPLLAVFSTNDARASEATEKILNEARAECKSFENGELTIDMSFAVSEVDVTGDGKLDEIVDSTAFTCSSAASLFCGTGGCALDVIVDGKTFDFLAKAWSVRAGKTQPELAIEVHWSECDYNSYCFEKLVWDGAEFKSLGANVEDPAVIMGLYDGPWTLQDYGDDKVTIEFNEDGSISGQGPCNTYRATYKITYPDIKIGPVLSTRMACKNSDEEFKYFKQLAKVNQIRMIHVALVLIQDDGTELTFRR